MWFGTYLGYQYISIYYIHPELGIRDSAFRSGRGSRVASKGAEPLGREQGPARGSTVARSR